MGNGRGRYHRPGSRGLGGLRCAAHIVAPFLRSQDGTVAEPTLFRLSEVGLPSIGLISLGQIPAHLLHGTVWWHSASRNGLPHGKPGERDRKERRRPTGGDGVSARHCSHRRPQAREPSWRSWRCLVCQAVLPPFASCPCGSCPDTASSGFRFQFQVEMHVLSLSAVVGAGRTPPGVGSMSTWRDGL